MAIQRNLTALSTCESHIDKSKIFELIKGNAAADQIPSVVHSLQEASNLLTEIQKKIKSFTKLRLLKLGEYDSDSSYWKTVQSLLPELQLPTDLSDTKFRLRTEQQLRDVGNTVLDDVKRLLTEHNLEVEILKSGDDGSDWINTWRYAFKAVDLLSDSGFVDRRRVESLSRDEELRKLVITSYINLIWKRTSALELEATTRFVPGRLWKILHYRIRGIIEEPYSDRPMGYPKSFEESLLLGFPRRAARFRDSQDKLFWNYPRLSEVTNVFRDLAEMLTEDAYWSPEMRLKAIRSWVTDLDKVMALYKDWEELSFNRNAIVSTLDRIKSYEDDIDVPYTYMASDLLPECQEKIKILTKMSLLRLAQDDSGDQYWGLIKSLLPEFQPHQELLDQSSRLAAEKKAVEGAGTAILNKAKKLISLTAYGLADELSDEPRGDWDLFLIYSYGFGLVDSLSENEFIDHKKLQSFFQEEEMAAIVPNYVDMFWRNHDPTRLPLEKGPWSQLNKSFKDLDSNTRRTIEDSFTKTYKKFRLRSLQ
ncbi:hypothetical protein PGTUg99_027349 [Puccinia graminis f. sp. tritici]|uniref:Uncharacterized protein n=2 Tax=Puccinia graminis f. sp. tritici TaxID=56615 RepID=A0A5B0RUD7_PUCGR|nr:hypothetical protein PGTUg99_027349 [Puccinia graminis f. sp. tritici]